MRHKLKYIISTLLIFANFICYVPDSLAEEKVLLSKDENVAEAYLNASAASKGFKRIVFEGTAEKNLGVKGGKDCWILDPKTTPTLNFEFSESFKPKKEFDGSTYDVEIEYYDEYEGFLQFEYDRKGRKEIEFDKIAFMAKDKTWKTLKFTLDDAVFNKGRNGFDFSLTIKATLPTAYYTDADNANPVAVRYIKVTKHEAKNPVYATSKTDVGGNSYAWFWEEKKVTNILENVSKDIKTVKVTSKMVSDKQDTPFVFTEEVTLNPGEIKEMTVDAGEVKTCGTYDWIVEIYEDDVLISKFSKIKVAILKADPDGIKDENIFFAYHSDRSPQTADNGFDVLALTNAGGARVELVWRNMIDAEGSIDWKGTSAYNAVMKLNERDMKAYAIMWGTPTTTGLFQYKELPKSKEQIEAWLRFADYVGREIAPYLSHIEIWNEPNLPSFSWNTKYETGVEYAKMAIPAIEIINQHCPDVKVAGPGITGIAQGPDWTEENANSGSIGGLHYILQTMEEDFHKYFNNVSVHAYAWGVPEASSNVKHLKHIKELWTNAGEEEPDMWITEAGFSKTSDYAYTDYLQGALNVRQILHLKEEGALGGLYCIYAFERKGYQAHQRESNFGVVQPIFAELPMYGTYAFPTEAALMITAMNYVMADSEFVENYNQNSQHIALYKSYKWDKNILTLYTESKGKESVTLNLGCDSVIMYDNIGNEQVIYGNNGVYTFNLADSAVYLVGDIKNVKRVNDVGNIKFFATDVTAVKGGSAKINVENNTGVDCTIEVDVPPCAEKVETIDFPNGSIKEIVIKNNADIGTKYRVKAKVKSSKGIIQTQDINIEVGKPVSVDFDCVLADTSDINMWTGILKVKNYSDSNALKGTVSFVSPDIVKGTTVDIGTIPKGTTGLTRFALPKMKRKGEFTFEYTVKTNAGETYSFSEPFNITIACYMDEKPIIDGVLSKDEWVYDSAMYADELGQVVSVTDWEWGGADDLSGRSGIGWDEENMYMFCEVTDDIFCQNNPVNRNWDGDGIQFGIVYNEAAGIAFGQMGTTFHEIGAALSPEGPGIYRYLSQDNVYPTGVVEDSEVAVKREGNKTYYEIRIPWRKLLLPGQVPKEGDNMGYSFLINEDDGNGRMGWIEYASGIGRNKNTGLFTILQLIK